MSGLEHRDGRAPSPDSDSDGVDEEAYEWEEAAPDDSKPHESSGLTVHVPVSDGLETAKKRRRVALRRASEWHSMHRSHVLLLLQSAAVRNKLCNDLLLRARLLSLQPPASTPTVAFAAYLRQLHVFFHSLDKSTDWISLSLSSELSHIINHAPLNASAILFTALSRALALPTRLIASIHPLPISQSVAALNPRFRPSSKNPPSELDSISLWTQVYNADSSEWINIHPESGIQPDTYFELPDTAPSQQQLIYVLAFTASGTYKDITQCFSTRWSRISKLRPPVTYHDKLNSEYNVEADWWKMVCWLGSGDAASRSMQHEVLENQKMLKNLEKEVMPNRFDGFKGHASYALERHCTQHEIIYPSDPQHVIAIFKGESVYPRSHVKPVYSVSTWRTKYGLRVRDGEVAIKRVKAKVASNLKRKREVTFRWANSETVMERGEGIIMESGDELIDVGESGEETELFGEWQMEPCLPEELINGKIPRNRFGNFELFHPNMMPPWGARVKLPLAAAVARKLGLDYVPVMVGFEHHRGRATPTIEGVIVLKENKDILVEAVHQETQAVKEKADKVKSQRALSNWRKLIEKAAIMSDLCERYL